MWIYIALKVCYVNHDTVVLQLRNSEDVKSNLVFSDLCQTKFRASPARQIFCIFFFASLASFLLIFRFSFFDNHSYILPDSLYEVSYTNIQRNNSQKLKTVVIMLFLLLLLLLLFVFLIIAAIYCQIHYTKFPIL